MGEPYNTERDRRIRAAAQDADALVSGLLEVVLREQGRTACRRLADHLMARISEVVHRAD